MPNDAAYADKLILHRLYLLRLEAGTAKRMVEAYDGAFADLTAELAALDTRIAAGESFDQARRNRLAGKLAQLDKEIQALRVSLTTELEATLSETAEAELRLHMRAAQSIGLSWTAVPTEQVQAMVSSPIGGRAPAGTLAVDLFEARTGVQDILARAMAQGASMDKAARMLRDAGALVETYRGRMVAVARTEIQRVANDVALATYSANDDVIESVEWLATLDSRTCLLCAPLHGQIFPLRNGRPVWMPSIPLHPRCRCFAAPVTRSWAELGLAPVGHVETRGASGPTFEQWLRRQSVTVQEDVLGADRLAIWRRGGTIDQFSDRGRLLRLGELHALT